MFHSANHDIVRRGFSPKETEEISVVRIKAITTDKHGFIRRMTKQFLLLGSQSALLAAMVEALGHSQWHNSSIIIYTGLLHQKLPVASVLYRRHDVIENIALLLLLNPSVRIHILYPGFSSLLLYNLCRKLGLARIVS